METDTVRPGGLMRCCLESIKQRTEEATEGTMIPCKYCTSMIRFTKGAWEWAGDEGDQDHGHGHRGAGPTG